MLRPYKEEERERMRPSSSDIFHAIQVLHSSGFLCVMACGRGGG
jgi:hypothetical protein